MFSANEKLETLKPNKITLTYNLYVNRASEDTYMNCQNWDIYYEIIS